MLKRFFYASAAVLMLALAYHLGASTATAQSGTRVFGFGSGGVSGVLGRSVYFITQNAYDGYVTPPVPGTEGIAAVANSSNGFWDCTVVLANGDVYTWLHNGPDWVGRGNVFGGATPTIGSTWGSLKARYRGEREAPTNR